jgi:hypothetical protein
MKWKDISLDDITKEYQIKILQLFEGKEDTHTFYGYSIKQWKEAFDEKSKMLEQRQLNNYLASQQLQIIRKTKAFRVERAAFKLLQGICDALKIEKP